MPEKQIEWVYALVGLNESPCHGETWLRKLRMGLGDQITYSLSSLTATIQKDCTSPSVPTWASSDFPSTVTTSGMNKTTDSDFLSQFMHKEYYSQYSPFDGVDDDGTKLLDSSIATSPPPKSRFLHLWPWLSHGVLMSITLVFFTLLARAPSIDDIVVFSPANEAIESIGIVKFNGSFEDTSIYRGSPSPELDAAWDGISLNGYILHFAPIVGDC